LGMPRDTGSCKPSNSNALELGPRQKPWVISLLALLSS
jgi:hypothetical protein